jgi:GH18 family chitinase
MKRTFSQHLRQAFSAGLFLTVLLAYGTPSLARAQAHERGQQKILAGYFEEWSIYGANYNVANLQTNDVANHIHQRRP